MSAHVERELARARAATVDGRGAADVAATIARIHGVLNRTPDGKRLRWRIAVPDGLAAAIDPADLSEALGALAENAARHAISEVAITAENDRDRVRVTIVDDGPGVPEDQISEIGRRGRRLDQRAPGEGMGVAIATDIAETAGGTLELRNSGKGFMMTLNLQAPGR